MMGRISRSGWSSTAVPPQFSCDPLPKCVWSKEESKSRREGWMFIPERTESIESRGEGKAA